MGVEPETSREQAHAEDRRAEAVRLRLSGLSAAEVGQEMGISRQRVLQLTRDAVTALEPVINVTPDQAKALADRYAHEKHEGESLPAWLRRLWIGDAE